MTNPDPPPPPRAPDPPAVHDCGRQLVYTIDGATISEWIPVIVQGGVSVWQCPACLAAVPAAAPDDDSTTGRRARRHAAKLTTDRVRPTQPH